MSVRFRPFPAIFILLWDAHHYRYATMSGKSSEETILGRRLYYREIDIVPGFGRSPTSRARLSRKSTPRAPRLDSDSSDNAKLNSGRIHINNSQPSPSSDPANPDQAPPNQKATTSTYNPIQEPQAADRFSTPSDTVNINVMAQMPRKCYL